MKDVPNTLRAKLIEIESLERDLRAAELKARLAESAWESRKSWHRTEDVRGCHHFQTTRRKDLTAYEDSKLEVEKIKIRLQDVKISAEQYKLDFLVRQQKDN